MRKIRVGRHFIPFWLIVSILIPCVGSGVLASYLWPNITIPFEVKEPIQILNYTSELSLFPGETKYINVTVQNHASINYNVTFEFQLSEPIYQTTYVTFSDEIYTIAPGEQQLAAWAKVDQNAPAITCSLTIQLGRIDEMTPIIPIIPPEPCAAAGVMWIEPSTVTLSTENIEHRIGYRFNVTVWVNLTVTCASWEFVMLLNKAHLNAVGCGYTSGQTSQFFENITTVPLIPSFNHHNSTHDLVLHGETWGLSAPFRNPGYGSLAWVEFEVVAEPAPGETLTSLLSISERYPEETYVQDPTQNKVSLCVYDCRYTFSNP
ncbi:MAG: hypothetical protein OEZ29_00860 [Candidatus Bathyarchaeota archaeon]|nr:hypothetical protein [Candidatus Bathyarchaeota archaeon]